MKNDIIGSEMGSGFEQPGGTPPRRILRSAPPPGFASNLSDYIVGGLVERGGGYLFERGEG